MSVKKWDIPWDAPAALIAFAKLDADEIAVAIQIMNLIYAQNGAIENDPKQICSYVKKMRADRCEKVINRLIHRNVLSLTNGLLMNSKCDLTLSKRAVSHDKYRVHGKSGADKRWGNEQNQGEIDRPPISQEIGSKVSSSIYQDSIPLSVSSVARKGYSIFDKLSDEGERAARAAAPGWDIRRLASIFDGKIQDGRFAAPGNPDSAFPAWCGKYTKGKIP